MKRGWSVLKTMSPCRDMPFVDCKKAIAYCCMLHAFLGDMVSFELVSDVDASLRSFNKNFQTCIKCTTGASILVRRSLKLASRPHSGTHCGRGSVTSRCLLFSRHHGRSITSRCPMIGVNGNRLISCVSKRLRYVCITLV